MNITKLEEFKVGDYYIDWCTGIDDYYDGPHEITDWAKFDDVWVVSWGMLEKVDKDHPKCADPELFKEEDKNYV